MLAIPVMPTSTHSGLTDLVFTVLASVVVWTSAGAVVRLIVTAVPTIHAEASCVTHDTY